eukprot:5827126-Amphidinium_carterae.1
MAGAPSTPISVQSPTEEMIPTSIVGSPQHSPTSAPVSAPTSPMPNVSELSIQDAWDCLCDEVYMSPQEACEYWKGLAFRCFQGLKARSQVDGRQTVTVFIHSTMETLKHRIPTSELGDRYAFLFAAPGS